MIGLTKEEMRRKIALFVADFLYWLGRRLALISAKISEPWFRLHDPEGYRKLQELKKKCGVETKDE